MKSVDECMCSEHEALAATLEQLAAAVRGGGIEDSRGMWAGLRGALQDQLRFERDSLLPEYEQLAGSRDSVPMLLAELSGLVRRSIDEVDDAFRRGDEAAAIEALAALDRLLADHHGKCRFGLYRSMDRLLAPSEREALMSRRSSTWPPRE